MKKLGLALVALVLGAVNSEAATLRTATTLHAPVVRLADLFDNAGANASRVLGPGPAAGGQIVVEAAQLRAIARQFGVDWRPASSADRAVLDRPGRPLHRDDVMNTLRTALIAGGASADCDVEISGFSPPLVPFEANPQPAVADLDYDAKDGRFSALVSVTGEGMDPLHLRIAGRVEDMVEVPVASSRLLAGTVLGADDVHMERVRSSMIRGEVVHQLSDAIGMQTKRQIASDQPFAVGDLVRPSMVMKGAKVLMVLDSPGISLTAEGKAMEPGAVGDRIRVVNPVSHVVIEAEVTGPDRVRVEPSGMAPIRTIEARL
jgi:flagella basal body P-ring formation protein FlgA